MFRLLAKLEDATSQHYPLLVDPSILVSCKRRDIILVVMQSHIRSLQYSSRNQKDGFINSVVKMFFAVLL